VLLFLYFIAAGVPWEQWPHPLFILWSSGLWHCNIRYVGKAQCYNQGNHNTNLHHLKNLDYYTPIFHSFILQLAFWPFCRKLLLSHSSGHENDKMLVS
jgi:hypothetical protein